MTLEANQAATQQSALNALIYAYMSATQPAATPAISQTYPAATPAVSQAYPAVNPAQYPAYPTLDAQR